MPDEENDIRIREAADNYHPAYDDTAWDKMEKMLDENLPQKKRRKKIFFLLPFLFLMGGSILFLVLNKGGKHSSETSGISMSKTMAPKLNDTKQPSANSSEESINTPLAKPVKSEINKAGLKIIPWHPVNINKTKQVLIFSMNSSRNKQHNYKKNLPVQSGVLLKRGSIADGNNDKKILKNEPNSFVPFGNESLNKNGIIYEKNNKKPEVPETNNPIEVPGNIKIKKQDTIAKATTTQSETINKKVKNANNFKNNFGITLSSGPDISGVNNAGKITIVYGAGLSYSISKKFTLRTGFYLSKKIYSIGPDDYHFPNASIGSYNNLQSVDANCNVDEIPINLYYSFGKIKNHNWFLSTGLSSYLMKKESYEYYYKTITGETYSKDLTIENKNKNIFSVLNLSAGYQHTFNQQFSIIAEPYIDLPLSGIGAGKVKLNSGGILFTITMKPFLKNGK